MIDTASETVTIEIRGEWYGAKVWREENGYAYAVRGGNGLLLCTGWTAGVKKEALAEARQHLRDTLMGRFCG